MLPIHTILHPTDFSDRSAYALKLACQLADDYGARLVLLHVAETPTLIYGEVLLPVEPEDLFQESREKLNRLKAPTNVHVERLFETGDPVTEILRVARSLPADLIVLGTHGRTGLSRLLMGSVAEPVVRGASCPVLTVSTPFPTGSPARGASVEEMATAGTS